MVSLYVHPLPLDLWPRASGGHIRQTTHAHVTTTTPYACIQNNYWCSSFGLKRVYVCVTKIIINNVVLANVRMHTHTHTHTLL